MHWTRASAAPARSSVSACNFLTGHPPSKPSTAAATLSPAGRCPIRPHCWIEVCRAKGYESICLITKNEAASQRLYSALRPRTKLHQLRLHDEDLQGTLIMPVYMSKGLEFDAVILCDADSASYQDAADRHLLYVTATRALHHLAVFCEGRMTPLITAKETSSCTN